MKIIITGATGMVGGATVKQSIGDPCITSIIILSRRSLPEDLISDNKVTVLVHEDFSRYPKELLSKLEGSEACLW